MNDLRSVQGGSTIKVINSNEPDRGYVAYVSDKQADWAGAGIDLAKYLKKHITISISAKIKAEGTGNIYITVKKNGNEFAGAGSVSNVPANTWTDVSGTFELDNAIKEAVIYFETTGNYFVDDFEVKIAAIGEPIPVTGVTLNKTEITMGVGGKETIVASIVPSDADEKGITWSSADPSIASVDTNGLVQGVSEGITTITAKSVDGNFAASCTVTISGVEFKLNRSHVVLSTVGDTVVLTPITGTDVTWKTSDAGIATINNGTVTAVAEGIVTITATNNETSQEATCIVDINTKAIFIEDFEDEAMDNLLVNDYAKLSVSDKEAYDGQYSLLLEATGEYNGVQYEFNNTSDIEKVYNVSAYVKSAQAGTVNVMLWQAGGSYATYANNPAVGSEWVELNTSTNNKDIKVPAGGKVIARFKSDGAAKFYIDNIVITEVINEAKEVTGVIINKSTLSLAKGKTEKLTLTVTPSVTDHSVVWKSSDDTIASVSADGTVTAVEVGGPVTITATLTDNLNSKTFTVTSEVTVTEDSGTPVESEIWNSGFEDEILIDGSGTKFDITSNMARTGKNSLLVSESNQNWQGPEFTLSQEGTYTVSAYVRTVSGSSINYSFMNKDTYSDYKSQKSNSDSEWTEIKATVTVASGAAVTLRIRSASANTSNPVSYYIDDFIVLGSDSSVIMSSGFEEFQLKNDSGTKFEITKADKKTGNKSLIVNNVTQSYQGPAFTLAEAGTYDLEVYVKSASDSQTFSFWDSNTYDDYGAVVSNDGSEWTVISGQVTVPVGGTTIRIRCTNPSADNPVSYYLDDFSVTKVS